jgi:hypothetical protein
VQHYSCLSARLAHINGAICPHVLQSMMAQESGTSEACDHALETCSPSHIDRPTKPFFIYLSPMAHWEPWDMWQHREPPWLGGTVRSHRTRGSTGAHLSHEARSEVIGHMAAPEPTLAGSTRSGAIGHVAASGPTLVGRRGLGPLDMW